MKISVQNDDAAKVHADVLVLKHAQGLYGFDETVVRRLRQIDSQIDRKLPVVNDHLLIKSQGTVCAEWILFIGVDRLRRFQYNEIREFAEQALIILGKSPLTTIKSIILTLHGANYGLDESEAFRSEIAGLMDALQNGDYPDHLDTIAIIEKNANRAARLSLELQSLIPDGLDPYIKSKKPVQQSKRTSTLPNTFQNAGAQSLAKPHIFVAMPFLPEFDDRFHYGIQSVVNSAGYLCERADMSVFTGDILAWIIDRIDTAALVIADLTTANPNVYLEVGYAWGRNIPTVLVVSDLNELRFDVKGHRCLVYNNSIRQLEEMLKKELKSLVPGA